MKEDFARTYGGYSDDDLASLHGEIDSLTADARLALLAEVKRRRLNEGNLSSLRDARTEYSIKIKREWDESRRTDAARMGTRIAIRVVCVIAGAVIAALIALFSSSH